MRIYIDEAILVLITLFTHLESGLVQQAQDVLSGRLGNTRELDGLIERLDLG